jgi:membrane protease YdiL (CAAX protease family)
MSNGDIPHPFPPRPEPPPAEAVMVPQTGVSQVPSPAGTPWSVPPRRVRRPHPGFWMALLWCIAFIFFTQVPPAIISVLILVVGALGRPDLKPALDGGDSIQALLESPLGTFSLMVAFFLAEVLVIGTSWLVIRLIDGREWPRRLALRLPSLTQVVMVLVAVPGMVLLADGSYYVLRHILHVPSLSNIPGMQGMEEMVKVFNSWPAPLAVLIIGVGPGIGEELWCRGFLGTGLVGRYGWLGVVAASFFFGFIHLDPCQGGMAMIMGLWLHFTYLMTRSLLVPMLLHFVNNSLSVISSRITVLDQLEKQSDSIPLYVYAAGILLLAAIGYALYRSRPRLVGEGGGPPLWKPAYPGVEYPPAGSGTRVVHPWPSIDAIFAGVAGCLVFLLACIVAVQAAPR